MVNDKVILIPIGGGSGVIEAKIPNIADKLDEELTYEGKRFVFKYFDTDNNPVFAETRKWMDLHPLVQMDRQIRKEVRNGSHKRRQPREDGV